MSLPSPIVESKSWLRLYRQSGSALQQQRPPCVTRVLEHIRRHVLNPKIRIALMLKDTLGFGERVKGTLALDDARTGAQVEVIDKGNLELLLKAQAQVLQLPLFYCYDLATCVWIVLCIPFRLNMTDMSRG